MNATVLLLGVLAAPAILAGTPAEPSSQPPLVFHTRPAAPVFAMGKTNSAPLRLPGNPSMRIFTNAPPAAASRRATTTNLAPGVYETAPYTCIVVVPKEHPDKMNTARVDEQSIEMPTVKPDLQFIPRKPVK